MVVIGDSLRSDVAHLVGSGSRKPVFISLSALKIGRA
jgi:hypothetical protein